MFLKKKTMTSMKDYGAKLEQMKVCLNQAEAVVIGAGAGLSTSAGLEYGGERFQRLFSDYIQKYGFLDMYSAAFYEHKSLEEFWGYFSKHIYHNRYHQKINHTYDNLFSLVNEKNYFVITTNVDHLFQQAGFDKNRLFYTQGDYGLFQCSTPCHQKTYDNKEVIYEMVEKQENFKIPTELIPYCPKCGEPMTTNLRKDRTFVEDDGWNQGLGRYEDFLFHNKNRKILFLELGVGFNTPSIIKYPFWQMTYDNDKATFIAINAKEVICAKEITGQSILIEEDISVVLEELKKL